MQMGLCRGLSKYDRSCSITGHVADAKVVAAHRAADFRNCEGLRRTALWDAAWCTRAVVGKPPVKEPAGM